MLWILNTHLAPEPVPPAQRGSLPLGLCSRLFADPLTAASWSSSSDFPPWQLTKKEADLSPRILILTSFIFFNFEFSLFFVPAQLSILIVSNRRVIQNFYSPKPPKIKVITALKRLMFSYFPPLDYVNHQCLSRTLPELTWSRADKT